MKNKLVKYFPRFDEAIYKRLYRSKEFIDDCYNKPIDLNTIAGQANFSPYHFLRLFKKIYETTPHKYLTQKRVEKAKELLKKNDMSITEICFDIGFESPGSFSTLFFKYTGTSPTEFKREYERRMYISVRFPEKLIPSCFLFFPHLNAG